jgi:ribosomal protein S18 acetylase RimI-like enzyme
VEDAKVCRVLSEEVYPLRLLVLRPGGVMEDCIWPGDDQADHWAVKAGSVVGSIASFYRVGFEDQPRSLQLRGMATHPEHRGKGLGKKLVIHTLEYYRNNGESVIWCNAREVAVKFYEKLGFRIVDSPFEIKGIGTHFRMMYSVDAYHGNT